jgi:TetR/AcrR family transcriptional regulator, cholesterol catabolism regulator
MSSNAARKKDSAPPGPQFPVPYGPLLPGGYNVSPAAALRIDRIVSAAAKLFDKVGYHAANMEMVAEAAGLQKPSLYHYVKSKAEILFRIHEKLLNTLNAQHRARVEEGQNREELLYGICKDILEFIAENRGFVRAFFENYRELDGPIRVQVRKERTAYFAIITDLISDGVAAGDYDTHEVTLSALFLMGQCNWAYQWYRPGQNPAPEVLARMMLDTFLYGVARKKNSLTATSSSNSTVRAARLTSKRPSRAGQK